MPSPASSCTVLALRKKSVVVGARELPKNDRIDLQSRHQLFTWRVPPKRVSSKSKSIVLVPGPPVVVVLRRPLPQLLLHLPHRLLLPPGLPALVFRVAPPTNPNLKATRARSVVDPTAGKSLVLIAAAGELSMFRLPRDRSIGPPMVLWRPHGAQKCRTAAYQRCSQRWASGVDKRKCISVVQRALQKRGVLTP